jgi:hypothetical protein
MGKGEVMKRNQRFLMMMIISLVALVVSACSTSAAQTPTREVTISVDEALAGQNALLAGLTSGAATVTEVQFSSFLSKLLEANSGPNSPVQQVTTWFEPEQLHLRVALKEGVLAPHLGNTLDLVGALAVNNGALQLDLTEAAVGPYRVTGELLQPIAAQINAALAQQVSGLPLEITLERGALNIQIIQ